MDEPAGRRAPPRWRGAVPTIVAFAVVVLTALVIAVIVARRDDTVATRADAIQAALDAALAAHAVGEVESAATGYRYVIGLDPQNKFAYYNLGLIEQSANQAADAERDYRAALNIDPGYVPALFNLAVLETEGDPAEAERLYRRALSADDANAAAHFNLGLLLIRVGRTDEGNAQIGRGVQLDPKLQSRVPPSSEPATTTTVEGGG